MTAGAEHPTDDWMPRVLIRHSELLGDPPVYRFDQNMEYAAPGTAKWCSEAQRLIKDMAAELERLDPGSDRLFGTNIRRAIRTFRAGVRS